MFIPHVELNESLFRLKFHIEKGNWLRIDLSWEKSIESSGKKLKLFQQILGNSIFSNLIEIRSSSLCPWQKLQQCLHKNLLLMFQLIKLSEKLMLTKLYPSLSQLNRNEFLLFVRQKSRLLFFTAHCLFSLWLSRVSISK